MPEAEETPAMATPPLTFAVLRRTPVLVAPATPTPRETKRLADIEDHDTLRVHVPFVFFYRGAGEDRNPAGAIRRALAEALVPYYPLAGRLREVDGRKLVVDCTGEGVLFVEADADVRLPELEAAGLRAPFPCMDELLFEVEGSDGILNCPLLFIQVTRLLCGGFVLALNLNHTICDAIGLAQFMSAVADIARGGASKVEPAWSRELLDARCPPKPTFPHREYEHDAGEPIPASPPDDDDDDDMVMRTFTFCRPDLTAIKNGLPPDLRNTATSFEVLTAAIWRARTAALELPPDAKVRLMFIVNVRGLPDLALPAGYYGNACVPSSVLITAGELVARPLGDAVELVREAKAAVTSEYVRSTLDYLVLHGRPGAAMTNLLIMTDNRHAGWNRLDFGWGEPVYGGPAHAALFFVSFLIAVKNGSGEDAVDVPIVLPQPAMDRFASEVDMLIKS